MRVVIPCALAASLAVHGAAPAAGPAERLAAAYADFFPAGSTSDAAVGGQMGARLEAPTAAQEAFGLLAGDVVLSVDGSAPGSAPASVAARPEGIVVWRAFPGQQPLAKPAAIGQQVVHDFLALPEAERLAVRLAVMLANQRTLLRDGYGIVLLPAPAPGDDAAWLRFANPLPSISEAAIAEVARAMCGRRRGRDGADRELESARDRLGHRDYIRSMERAARALVLAVETPGERRDPALVRSIAAVYLEAQRRFGEDRERLLAPVSRLGLLFEGSADRIQGFPPQNTLFSVDAATGWSFAVGARLRVPIDWKTSSGTPILNGVFFVTEYGQIRSGFDRTQTRADVIDPNLGERVVDTVLQRVGFELMYRPTLATRLRPYIRWGPSIYMLSVNEDCSGAKRTALRDTQLGWSAGGGLDVFEAGGVRASLNGTYRILRYSLGFESPWQDCERSPGGELRLDPDEGYRLDMDGWQVGLLLSWDL